GGCGGLERGGGPKVERTLADALGLQLNVSGGYWMPAIVGEVKRGGLVAKWNEACWESCGGLELDPVLGSGAVVLMDSEWMVRRARTGGVLEPRQALPPTAFMPHSAVKAATPLVPLLRIACISHGWLQAGIGEPGELLLPPRHCRLHADAVSR
ncbi:unnamed protein product, partial [Prorocentrum cordatum]